jgi:O-antigen/teichoic acid export membrane protein
MTENSSTKGSFVAGYVWSLGATALPLVALFLISLITARLLGPRVVGLINSTMAFSTVLLIIGKYGVEGASSRLMSEYDVTAPWRIPRLIRLSVLQRLLFTVPTAIAAAVFAPQFAAFFKEPALVAPFRLGAFLIFAVSLNELSDFLLIGISRFRLLFVMRLAVLVCKVGLVYAVAFLGMGAAGVIGMYGLGAIVPTIVAFFILFRIPSGSAPPGDTEPIWTRLLRLSTPLAVSYASFAVFTLQDKLMLQYYRGAETVGLYSMARNLTEAALFPTFALVMTLRPSLASGYASGNRERCADVVNRSMRAGFLYGALALVVFACLPRPLVVGLFTAKFAPSAEILLIFLPLIVMRSIGVVVMPGLIAAERAGTYARLTVAGAVSNFILNVLLIPRWRAEGAAVATVVSYVPIEIVGLIALWRAFPRFWHRGDWIVVVKTAPLAAATILCYHLFVPEPANLAVTILHALAVCAVFTGALVAVRALTREEIREVVRSLGRRGGR